VAGVEGHQLLLEEVELGIGGERGGRWTGRAGDEHPEVALDMPEEKPPFFRA